MKAVLLDIEGTTTPISFVHDTLFPYARARMGGFILDNLGDLKFEIEQLVEEQANDPAYKGELRPDSANSVSDYLKYLIDQDRKSTPLKTIQGMMWQTAYESGEIVSPVFDDVPPAFKRWKDAGIKIAVYSSGSVLAQKLLFRHTEHGDLTVFISDHFDTNIGDKKMASSYWNIAKELEIDAKDIMFISDSLAELDAALTGGYQTALSVRPGNASVADGHSHPMIRSFDEVNIEATQNTGGSVLSNPN